MQPPAIKHAHRDLEAFAFRAEHIFRGHGHVIEMDIADMRTLLAHFLFRDADAQARRVSGDEERRDALCAGFARARHDREQMSTVGIGDVAFGAGQPPLIAIADRAGFDVGAVGADIGFGERETRDDLARGNAGEPFGLLVGGACHDQPLRSDADIGAEGRAHRGRRFAERHADFDFLEHVQAEPAIFRVNRQPEQTEGFHFSDKIGGDVVGFRDFGLSGAQAFSDEPFDGFDQRIEGFRVEHQ